MNYNIKLPGRYYQGDEVINNLSDYVKHLGDKCLIIISPKGSIRYSSILDKQLRNFNLMYYIKGVTNTTDINLLGLDFIIGVGGGTIIDYTKRVSNNLNIPYVIIPTVLSSDAASNSISVPSEYDNKDTMITRCNRNPDIVIVDTDILKDSPKEFLLSGIGDALSTNVEAKSSFNTTGYTMTHSDAPDIFLYCLNNLNKNLMVESINAIKFMDTKNYKFKNSFDIVVRSILFDSSILSENCGIAVPHAFSLAVDEVIPRNNILHGYKVSVGILLHFLIKYNKVHIEYYDDYNYYKNLMNKLGLPTTLSDIGIHDNNTIMIISESICSNKLLYNTIKEGISSINLYNCLISIKG